MTEVLWKMVNYLENNVDNLRSTQNLPTKYNNLDEPDTSGLRRFKDFVRRNFGVIAFTTSIVCGLALLVITMVSFVRSSLGSAAKTLAMLGKTFDFAKKVGVILAPIFTALATILFWSTLALSWLSQNLWFMFVILAEIVYNVLKRYKYV